MRTIAVVTVGRSDYGIYLPLLRAIQSEAGLRLVLVVAGMHLSKEYGLTVEEIEADGFHIGERVHMAPASDSAEAVGHAMGVGTSGFAGAYARLRPDLLVLLGDRYEMHSAAAAAVPFNIPVAHIHGGESTEGAIDEQFRHSITKMSHLHFASTELYARRIIQMGEQPWRVTVSGAPALDNLRVMDMLTVDELSVRLGVDLSLPTLLVTYHPVTLEIENTEEQMRELLAALERWEHNVVFTYPNADPSNRLIVEMILRSAEGRERFQVKMNLGTQVYFSLMGLAAAMVGNSSSGIIEAASFKLPVVNIGKRQAGRIRPDNVIDVEASDMDILEGIRLATSSDFRGRLAGLVNPYGDGRAADRIVAALKSAELGDRLMVKRFQDVAVEVPAGAFAR